jgi:hypothetical protein
MNFHNREFLTWKERWGRDTDGWAGRQAGIFKVSLGLGEIEGRDRITER